MSGLRRVPTFEEALAAATQDEQRVEGVISPYLQNHATRVINSLDFQRVKDRLTEDLETQERHHVEQKTFTNNIQGLAVEARVNRNDMDYIIRNLQQPPAPPPVPPPSTDIGADRERLAAELEGIAQQRQRAEAAAALAQRTYADIQAQRMQSPVERIIERHVAPPPAQPTFVQPDLSQLSEAMRHFGVSMQQLFLRGQRPRDEIDIQYTAPQQPPPGGQGSAQARAPGALGYGRAALADTRPAPYAAPPTGQGRTSARGPGRGPAQQPSAPRVRTLPDPPGHYTAEQKLDWYLAHQQGRPPPQVARQRAPSTAPAAPRQRKRPAAEQPAAAPPPPGRRGLPMLTDRSDALGSAPANTARAQAIQRMREVGQQGMQNRRRSEMVERVQEGRRAVRRGGAVGDVVSLGKRKLAQEGMPAFQPRQRTGERRAGPQMFSLTV